MNILLHGATNMSNFGDYLFAELFYRRVLQNGDRAVFYSHPRYGISPFFVKHLNYPLENRHYLRQMKQCDALVFIPGGYFADTRRKQFIYRLRHLFRYMFPAVSFMLMRKPIYVLGVGAGPFSNSLFSRLALHTLNTAKTVCVRNEESRQYCLQHGITNQISVTADTALLTKAHMEAHGITISERSEFSERKALFVHIDSSPQVTQLLFSRIAPAVDAFLKLYPEYTLYLGADSEMDEAVYSLYEKQFSLHYPQLLRYDDPWKLCTDLSGMDIVITTKLHVGIVSCVFGCSVLSFPFVPSKTKRLYKQIKEEDRCIPLTEVTQEQVLQLMKDYKDRPVSVPEELLLQAQKNLDAIPSSFASDSGRK